MEQDNTQQAAPATNATPPGGPRARQAITGLTPPQLGEALIREVWPAVASTAGLSNLAQKLMKSIVLAPLGWLLLGPLFALKFGPFVCRRYTLTNRRLMIQRGFKPHPIQEVALADIDDVRLHQASYQPFYRSGDLEILAKGTMVMRLRAVPEPDSYRHAILNAVKAWVPGKATGPFLPASAGAKT